MKDFMDKDFLLGTDTARHLYHDYAAAMPLVDYHCHIPPREIYEDRRFDNLVEVWLGGENPDGSYFGDHYKWRLMRSTGVSGKYHIAHGVSNAILLAPVMRFNEPACRERLAAAYDRCCHDEERTCKTAEEKSAWIIRRLEEIVKHLDIPTSLKEFGVPAEDLDGLVEAGMQVQRLLVNNMREVTPEDARALYLEVL